MKYLENLNKTAQQGQKGHRPVLSICAFTIAAVLLSACGDKAEKKPGQALVNVNGEEITVLQLNEELSRANVPAAQQEAGRKQLLEALVDRQLLVAEANKEKLDRDPKVVSAIERAKATILAQSYLQRRIGQPARPTRQEVEAYYNQNPQFFSDRKQFNLQQLNLPTAAVTDEVKKAIDASKSLDEVAAWLTEHKVQFGRAQVARTTTDIPPQLSSKFLALKPGQLFIIREGDKSIIMTIAEIKSVPLALETAAPQIEQFLVNRKNKEAADAEVKRLRAAAKIEYLGGAGNAPAGAAAPAAAADAAATTANERGVSGLK